MSLFFKQSFSLVPFSLKSDYKLINQTFVGKKKKKTVGVCECAVLRTYAVHISPHMVRMAVCVHVRVSS